jgi:RNA polymerase sigma factor (sigma-70 family)
MLSQFETYKQELGKPQYNPITNREEEKALLMRYRETRDLRALDRLVMSNMRFVVFILKEYSIPPTMDIMDIIQEGNTGLMVGVQKFDTVRFPEIKLFSYVVHWIRFYIRHSLAVNNLYDKKMAALSTDETVDTSSRRKIDVEDAKAYMCTDTHEVDTVAAADIQEFLLSHLEPREAAILRLYYTLSENNSENQTLESIGQQLHIKFVRVRQIRDKALLHLRELAKEGKLGRYF